MYYKILTETGHRGCGKSGDMTIYIEARSIYEAIKKARRFPSVKHKRMPNAVSISADEYLRGRAQSAYRRRDCEI